MMCHIKQLMIFGEINQDDYIKISYKNLGLN